MNEERSVRGIAGKLNMSLNGKRRLVYMAEDFFLKDRALNILKKLEDKGVEIVDDPAALELYRMYEFCDKFIVLSESEQYGSIWNYVKKGMISPEEALDAVLAVEE